MCAEEMWTIFAEQNGLEGVPYEAWAFDALPDELAELVLQREKTGTSSAWDLYEVKNEQLPEEGAYSVLLNGKNEAVCIIRTTRVYVVPFNEVTDAHAYREGEGDKSLVFWRKVHQSFFTEALKKVGLPFHEAMKVVCEEFELVYR